MVLLAGLASLIVGVALTFAGSAVVPCLSDKAGCGLGEAYRVFFVPAEVLLCVFVFGIAAPGTDRERPLKLAMYLLVMVGVILLIFAVGDDQSRNRLSFGSFLEMLQVLVVYFAVIAVQWLVIHSYVQKR